MLKVLRLGVSHQQSIKRKVKEPLLISYYPINMHVIEIAVFILKQENTYVRKISVYTNNFLRKIARAAEVLLIINHADLLLIT